MAATLKINSTFNNYFDQSEYQVDAKSYYDLEFYLKGIHPRFNKYMTQIRIGEAQEGFGYVDSDLKVIETQNFGMKKISDGDVIHLVPVVTGGGGKKGFLFAAVAIIAISFMIPVAIPAVGGPPGLMATSSFGAEFFAGASSLFGGLPSFVQGIIGNLALSFIGSLFTSKPKGKQVQVTKDSNTRSENNMFGSLQNTTTSGTPVSVNYGQMRIAGQFLSGYILSQQHDQDNAPTIESIFNPTASPLASDAGVNL